MTASNATGQLIFLPLLAGPDRDGIGWRAALTFVDNCILALALVLALLFIRDRPSDLGLAPFGGTRRSCRRRRRASG